MCKVREIVQYIYYKYSVNAHPLVSWLTIENLKMDPIANCIHMDKTRQKRQVCVYSYC